MYRYIGNKTRLAAWLITRIKEFAPSGGTVVDLMCGTASVADALRGAGYRVIASDIMTYAMHHARARLLLADDPKFSGLGLSYATLLRYLNLLPPVRGLFFREYSPEGEPLADVAPRKYLSGINASRLDAINETVSEWRERGLISEIENSLLRHDMVLAVNRVANIAGTYGHYRSTWSKAALAPLTLLPSTFSRLFRTDHEVIQGAAEDVAKHLTADVCYIDPPYMKRQYAANYHLIETVARGDFPEAIGISGLRPWRDQYSVFCTRTKIQDAFRRIITEMNCSTFLVSYSSDGLLSEKELLDLFEPLATVSIEKRCFPRFRSNQSQLGPVVEEYLITLRKVAARPAPSPRAADAMLSFELAR